MDTLARLRATHRPALAFLAVLIIAFTFSAPVGDAKIIEIPVGSSDGCVRKFDPRAAGTAVCMRIIVPETATTGVPYNVTLKFKARKSLKNVTLRVRNPLPGKKYVFDRKYKLVVKGRQITKTIPVTVPTGSAASSGFPTKAVQAYAIATAKSFGQIVVYKFTDVSEPAAPK